MRTPILYTKLQNLPDHLKQEVADFIDFLLAKSKSGFQNYTPHPGTAKGKVRMSADFDAPIDEFKEYLP